MRFNELIAGVRGDVAVKVFGDEFEPMLAGRRSDCRHPAGRRRRHRCQGRAEPRVCQCLEIAIDKAEIARRGLSLAAVQDVIGTAIGGREAGAVFEGDRAFRDRGSSRPNRYAPTSMR